MRFIKDISQETRSLLRRIYKSSKYHRVRQRAHCILLSNQGYTTSDLMGVFDVSVLTIYNWFDGWEKRRLCSLYDKKGKGRKAKLDEKHKEKVREWINIYPKNIGKVCALIKEEFGILVSKKTVKRILKALMYSWHRIKKKVKGKPDSIEYGKKKEELEELKVQDEKGLIDLRFFDETGFCLDPYVPYAWQAKGSPIEIETTVSKRLNVLGFLNVHDDLKAYTIEDNITTEVVTACIDDFCEGLKKKTVLVIDNASVHRSKALKRKIPEWKLKGLELFYLPTYSPELNLIEILWRFIKYEWIQFDAYKSWKNLVKYVEDVINNFGREYKINYG